MVVVNRIIFALINALIFCLLMVLSKMQAHPDTAIKGFVAINESAQFEALVQQKKYAVVKVGATWCGACSDMKDRDGDIATKFQKQASDVGFYSLDDKVLSDELRKKYIIQGYPTYLFLKKGELQNSVVGGMDKDTYAAAVEKLRAIK